MKVLEARINIFFPPIVEKKETLESIALSLSNSYNLANINAIQTFGHEGIENFEAIPHEIPRIVGKSIHEHSELTVSLNKAEIIVMFDSVFHDSIDKCIEYLNIRSEELYNALNQFVNDKYFFSGVTFTIVFDHLGNNPIDIITERFAKLKSAKKLHDVSSKFTYIAEDFHYINLNISNIRGVEEVQNSISNTLIKKVNYLSITLDVNDRYGFNEVENYQSNYEKLKKNINIIEDLSKNKLEKLIEGEELLI